MAGPFKMKGSPMARNYGAPFRDEKKSYTTKDPKKSYMKEGESEFGLYKGNTMSKKWYEDTNEKADEAVTATVAAAGGTLALGATGGAGAVVGGSLTGAGIVAAEGSRRIKAGTTNAKEREATKFSNNKTWSEAKKTKTPKKNQKINFNKGK
jgi:hypothetical protein